MFFICFTVSLFHCFTVSQAHKLEVTEVSGEAGFKAFDFEIQFHAAVELRFLGGAGEALVFGQRGAAAFGSGGSGGRRELARQPVSRAAACASNCSIQP